MTFAKRIIAGLLTFVLPEVAFYYAGRSIQFALMAGLAICLIKILISSFLGYLFDWKITLIVSGSIFVAMMGLLVVVVQFSFQASKVQPLKSRKAAIVLLAGLTLQVISFYVRNVSELPKYRTYLVPSASMYPTILSGDRIVAELTKATDFQFERGDIIVFRSQTENIVYVKRIVAVGGDHIKVRRDLVDINGVSERIDKTSSSEHVNLELCDISFYKRHYSIATSYKDPVYTMFGKSDWPQSGDYLVPQDHFFVMGDNRSHSNDSRSYGDIGRDEILGKVHGVAYHFSSVKLMLLSRMGLDLL